jgi:cytochrome c553
MLGTSIQGRRIDAALKQCGLAAFAMVLATAAYGQAGKAQGDAVRRGQYLSIIGGCNDCHTPKVMTPQGPAPDAARTLSGHPANAQLSALPAGVIGPDKWGAVTNNDLTAWVGPWGTSFAANLTPDKATGLGAWTFEQFSKTMRTGKHLGVGRPVLPPMPWQSVAMLTDQDMRAMFAYLQSLKPIVNQVPQPIPPK